MVWIAATAVVSEKVKFLDPSDSSIPHRVYGRAPRELEPLVSAASVFWAVLTCLDAIFKNIFDL